MIEIINTVFTLAKSLFDKVTPEKLKGLRSVLGFVGLGVVAVLDWQGIGSPELLDALKVGFTGFTALALNAKEND